MQRSSLAVAVAIFLVAAALPGGVAVQASAAAAAERKALFWLRAHRNAPRGDELADLKDQNPEAYAIVKALLTKRSLGLLDPRHPTASFAAPPAAAQSEAEDSTPQGAAAFEKIAEESGEPQKAAPMYADAPVSTHHDWLSWKPQQSAMDDEAMVKSVLGAVAGLKAGSSASLRGRADSSGDALSWSDNAQPAAPPVRAAMGAALAATDAPVVAAPEQPQAPVSVEAKPSASMSQGNTYLKGIDFGSFGVQPPRPQTPAGENSYLKGWDLTPSTAAAPSAPATPVAAVVAPKPMMGLSAVKQDSTNYLSGFSWDDASPASEEKPKAQPQKAVPAQTPKVKQAGGNVFFSWLNGAKPAAPKKKAVPAPTQAPEQNSYMMDLA